MSAARRRMDVSGTVVRSAIDRAAATLAPASDSARIDAEVLLAHALGRTRAWVLAHAGDAMEAEAMARFAALVERRREGWPVAYLVGGREFWSRPFRVTPDVLIPRPETEQLVEAALARLPAGRPCRVADLGTGSGVIALTLALERPDCALVATDASAAALEVARGNAASLGAANVEFRLGDWCAALHGGETFDLVASNPPYVRADDPHLDRGDLRFEPEVALAAGPGGLEAIERIAAGARGHLVGGGWLVLEHGHDQAEAVAALLGRHGYSDIEGFADLAGHPRMAAARLPRGPR
jgi:release factor glutamine methyltransferase